MPIFQDENGMAIKFFIQKDIPQEIQAEVCDTITALGGRVESKVPRAGYILVQNGTPEAERLRQCWASHERPERYFVPYTYVDACKIQGMLLKQIFVHEGQPIRMHIDSSIANVNVRATLSARIQHSGGDPTASMQNARVILADPNTDVFQHLVKTYQGEPDKYVESYLWVKKCIEKGGVIYTPVVYKNPGGRRAGEERTQFSEEDEDHLCRYIATKIPYKETGGRTGNKLYQLLVEMANEPEYAWVTRHTWQSWRERYKKNAPRLDNKIRDIVERNHVARGEKGQYGYVRMPEEKPKRSRKKSQPDTSQTEMVGPSSQELELMSGPVILTQPGPLSGPMDGQAPYGHIMYAPFVAPHQAYPQIAPPPPAPLPANIATARPNAQEEEMDEECDWQIKVGTTPQPQWAKRRIEEEEPDDTRKRSRISPMENAMAVSSELHVIDQAILDIATELRFTPQEVQEFYDRCGDVDGTRHRFRAMRDLLSEQFPLDPPPAQ